MHYVQVVGDQNADGEIVEVPLETSDLMTLSTLQSIFNGATGLKYVSDSGASRAVRLVDGEFHPPEGGWAERAYTVVIKKEAPPTRSRGATGEGLKRGRDEDDGPVKRSRDDCYRCGGSGHIADMCTSPWDAKDLDGLPECYLCKGKGHVKGNCPNTIPRGMCYKCHNFGHSGRDCKMQSGQAMTGGDMLAANSLGMAMPYATMAWGADGYGYGSAAASYQPMAVSGTLGVQVCYRCQQAGHRAMECPRLKDQNISVDSCFKCGAEGHHARECNVGLPAS